MAARSKGPPPSETQPFLRVIVPIEGTDREFIAQQQAAQLAASIGAGLFALHIDTGERPATPKVFSYVEQEAKRWGVSIQSRNVMADDVVSGVLNEVQPLDLIVIGTRRMSARYHVGSVAAQLVERAPCPVLVVRLPK